MQVVTVDAEGRADAASDVRGRGISIVFPQR
jgi:hypothetical protein